MVRYELKALDRYHRFSDQEYVIVRCDTQRWDKKASSYVYCGRVIKAAPQQLTETSYAFCVSCGRWIEIRPV